MLELTEKQYQIPYVIAKNFRKKLNRDKNDDLYEEVLGECIVLLLKALKTFDPSKESSLTTYLWTAVKFGPSRQHLRGSRKKRSLIKKEVSIEYKTSDREMRVYDKGTQIIEAKDFVSYLRTVLSKDDFDIMWRRFAQEETLSNIAADYGYLRDWVYKRIKNTIEEIQKSDEW